MKCKERDCPGEIAFGKQIIIEVNDAPRKFEPFFPCDLCGLLHDDEGHAIEHTEKGRPYKKGNEVIYVK